jgi:hypothetical protein
MPMEQVPRSARTDAMGFVVDSLRTRRLDFPVKHHHAGTGMRVL